MGCRGFADDTAPADALVAVPDDGRAGTWSRASLDEARRRSDKVQGRRSTVALRHPVAVPTANGP